MKIELLRKVMALCLVVLVSGFAWGMTPMNSCGDKDKDKATETFAAAVFTAETDAEGDKAGDPDKKECDKDKKECDKDKDGERKECPHKDKDQA